MRLNQYKTVPTESSSENKNAIHLTFIIIIILHICVIFIIFVPVKTISTMAKLNVIAKFIRNGGIHHIQSDGVLQLQWKQFV